MDIALPQVLEERIRWEKPVERASDPVEAIPVDCSTVDGSPVDGILAERISSDESSRDSGKASTADSPISDEAGSTATGNPCASRSRQSHGSFVLYWMHSAMRAHENPALDAAIVLARRNHLPLLVYQGLGEDYPYASDRHHAFILQGAKDVQRDFRQRGIRYVFHLQRPGHRGPHLKQLTEQAAIVVTEEMPVEPLVGWLERLRATTNTPILCVDSACVVPMPLTDRAYERAYHFRDATKKLQKERIAKPWIDEIVDVVPFQGDLPFEPLDLDEADICDLIGQCEIDHLVAPVRDTVGGSRAAIQRWEHFKQTHLRHYEKRRNDAAAPEAVSRMSAYLHYGMVSPFQMAREAHAMGAEKFLDELLVWRELAYHFCYHRRHDVDSLDAVPTWARETLKAHRKDPRQMDLGWESLARAKSGDTLWDACQRSLLKHGELHNNVRMTWCKAFLPWTKTPDKALACAIDLNHRYALDGRDPCSYGGLLWGFGQFDRPSEHDSPVIGTLRPRPLCEHANRIDLDRYRQWVDRPIADRTPRVAIVGAGIAGLVAGRGLSDHGVDVQIFDKSRGVGGRTATRRAASGVLFDHGAQYFTMRDPRFAKYVCSWFGAGLVAPWGGKIAVLNQGQVTFKKPQPQRYVAIPGMNALPRHLSEGLAIRRETPITQIRRTDHGWKLYSDNDDDLGCYDWVILNCPPPQAATLLPKSVSFYHRLQQVTMEPCWTVLVELAEPLELEFDAAFVHENPLSWIACDSSKPGRPSGTTWVLQASGEWSWEHIEDDPDEVLAELLAAFADATGYDITDPITLSAHRWRYAKPLEPLSESSLWDPAQGIGACGDWCGQARIEGAFLSGASMAGQMLRTLTLTDVTHGPTMPPGS